VTQLNRRLERLEAGRRKWENAPYIFDPNGNHPKDRLYRLHFKMCERSQAFREGREVPAYRQENIEELRRLDVELTHEGGIEEWWQSPGWQSPEALATLEAMETEARRRLELGKGLAPEEWPLVWGVEEEEKGALPMYEKDKNRQGSGAFPP
jgi:hypothetical protein